MIAASPIGRFTRIDFKEALRLIFDEVSEQKKNKLEARLQNRLRLVGRNKCRSNTNNKVIDEVGAEIEEIKARI